MASFPPTQSSSAVGVATTTWTPRRSAGGNSGLGTKYVNIKYMGVVCKRVSVGSEYVGIKYVSTVPSVRT
eukprot:1159304-Pelagomonas_calceolata.AAC.5